MALEKVQNSLRTNDIFVNIWEAISWVGANPFKRKDIYIIIYITILRILVNFGIPVASVIGALLAESIERMLEDIVIIIPVLCNVGKFIYLCFNYEELASTHQLFDKLDERIVEEEDKEMIKKSIKWGKYIFISLAVSYEFTLFLLGLSALKVSLSGEKRLLCDAWFGFDWTANNRNWSIAFTFQLIALSVTAVQIASTDSYPCSYIYALTKHYRILKKRVESLGTNPQKTDDDNYNDIINCFKDYQIILMIHSKIQNMISFPSFIQFLTTASGLISIGLSFLFTNMDTSRLVFMIVLTIGVSGEIFYLCIFANTLEVEIFYLTNSLYNCNWIDQNVKFRKILISFMQRSQQEGTTLAGKWIPINYNSYLKMLKISYSFLAIFGQIKDYNVK